MRHLAVFVLLIVSYVIAGAIGWAVDRFVSFPCGRNRNNIVLAVIWWLMVMEWLAIVFKLTRS